MHGTIPLKLNKIPYKNRKYPLPVTEDTISWHTSDNVPLTRHGVDSFQVWTLDVEFSALQDSGSPHVSEFVGPSCKLIDS